MKITVTVPHFSLDIGRNESGLGTGLRQLGHEPTVIATDLGGAGIHGGRHKQVPDSLPYRLIVLPRVPGSAINPVPVGMRSAFRESSADVIHSSEDTDMLTVFAYKAARSLRLPFVLSTERYYVPKFPKSVGYRIIERTWTRRIREEAEAVTTHSTIQMEYWRSRGLQRPDAVMIPVGTWTDKFSPGKSDFLRTQFKIPSDATLGFTVGRMTDYKDYPTMLRAMRAVVDRDPSVFLVVVGFGPDRARVIKMARGLGLEKNVIFTEERISHARIPEALRSCDFYLQTSSVEPFGIAVVEAMSTGTPVVTTDVGGMRDTVVEGVVGLKAPAGDSGKVAEAVLRMRDPELRAALGRAGRERAVTRFDWMVVCRSYIEVYRRALESHAAGGAPASAGMASAESPPQAEA